VTFIAFFGKSDKVGLSAGEGTLYSYQGFFVSVNTTGIFLSL